MRIVVAGQGPLLIEAFLHYFLLDPSSIKCLLTSENLLGDYQGLLDHFPNQKLSKNYLKLTSFLGRKFLKDKGYTYFSDNFETKEVTVVEYYKNYLEPLINNLPIDKFSEYYQNIHVTRRFFADGIFSDKLFRIVYKKEFKDEENHYKKGMPKEILDDLERPIEYYQDADIFIGLGDLYNYQGPTKQGIEYALNEKSIRFGQLQNYFIPGISEIFSFKKKLKEESIQTIGFIIDDSLPTSCIVNDILNWLKKDKKNNIFFIFYNKKFQKVTCSGFEAINLLKKSYSFSDEDFNEFFTFLEKQENEKQQKIDDSLRKWENLDDHIKERLTHPTKDSSSLNIFLNYDILSIDYLSDRKTAYLTLETENQKNLNTLGADLLYSFIRPQKDNSYYFSYHPSLKNSACFYLEDGRSEEVFENFPLMVQDSLSYFSRK